MGIGLPEVRPSGMPTDATIISETAPLKKEAGMVQGAMASQDEMLVVRLRG
jgi:hypothetical protein